jgi:streptomycin 6-kinase
VPLARRPRSVAERQVIHDTTKHAALDIPEKVRRTALARGEDGLAWLAGLGELVAELEHEWDLSIGRTFSTGTEAFVAEAVTADGRQGVLKIPIPGLDPSRRELRTLLAANGRSYVQVLRHEMARGVMLLERLGPQLHQLGLPVDAQIALICATLQDAWTQLPDGLELMSGAEKANNLAALIKTAWSELGKPCSERAIDKALSFADVRRRAFNPENAVLAHGDAHAWNTLLVPGGGPRRFKFVDPDGLFIEHAYDLCISLREWGSELLAGDPLALGRRRCHRLARLTGVEPEPIWQWGFIERLWNGLLLQQKGLDKLARESLTVADAWALGDL